MADFTLTQRFEKKFKKTRGCWVWTGALAKNGYGQVGAGGKRGRVLYAHRVAYELYVGKIPDDSLVCHTCDNRRCVNPDHLFLGSHKDNMQDVVKKGRTARGNRNGAHTHPGQTRGEKNGQARLTERGVREILRRSKTGITPTELAQEFNVSPSSISLIVARKRWAHVEV